MLVGLDLVEWVWWKRGGLFLKANAEGGSLWEVPINGRQPDYNTQVMPLINPEAMILIIMATLCHRLMWTYVCRFLRWLGMLCSPSSIHLLLLCSRKSFYVMWEKTAKGKIVTEKVTHKKRKWRIYVTNHIRNHWMHSAWDLVKVKQ